MEKILILTDSSADIPRALCEQYGIEIVPIIITCASKTLREHYDITPQEYWKLLETSVEIPTTAQVTPSVFMEAYESAYARGFTHIFSVLISSSGSGTFQSACVSRDLFYEQHGRDMQIELLDSQTYTYMYGSVVVEAARMRAENESFEAIVALAKSRLARAQGVLGVYSLKHLKKSGRISGGAAFVGEALGLRPISLIGRGAVTVVSKVRGDKNVVPAMVALVKKNALNPAAQTADLLFGDVPSERIDALAQALLAECGFAHVDCWPFGAAVLTNTGPHALAVSYRTIPNE